MLGVGTEVIQQHIMSVDFTVNCQNSVRLYGDMTYLFNKMQMHHINLVHTASYQHSLFVTVAGCQCGESF